MTAERLLSARQLADLLGFAAGTVVDWAERDELPAFKVGGRLRFRESEVLAWLETRRLNGPGSEGEQCHPFPLPAPGPAAILRPSPVPQTEGEPHAS